MIMWSYVLLVSLSTLTVICAEDPAPQTNSGKEEPAGPPKCINIATGLQIKCPENLQAPPQGNVLDYQFQYPPFNYVPSKQLFPRIQPQVIFYAGAAPPGQQFLYRPGSPPGNFLIPQPQPQPQPGPGVIFGGQPQGPVFVAGYPKPAHIPPIEKDAEEVPNLAGNHPPSAVGRPYRPPQTQERKPEKLETLDEPVLNGEVDVLEAAEKNPNNFYPRKPFPAAPALKPGQQFFILNGQPIFSNFPLAVGPPQPNYNPNLYQPNPEFFLTRQPIQPQAIPEYDLQQFNPIKNFFYRNSVTGEITDVKSIQAPFPNDLSLQNNVGNYVSLNAPETVREKLTKTPEKLEPIITYVPQRLLPSELAKEYHLTEPEAKEVASTIQKLGRSLEYPFTVSSYNRGAIYPGVTAFGDQYKYRLRNLKDYDDDTVVIDARVQDDGTRPEEANPSQKQEEPSISQAQPAAVALSGKGGVASAGPRGTALVGLRGLAVASPQATAVAGPSSEDSEKKGKKKKEQR